MAEGKKSKIVLGLFTLVGIGVFIWQGIERKWFSEQNLNAWMTLLEKGIFWENVAIVLGVALIILYFVPPFKQTMKDAGLGSYFLLIVVILGSIAIAHDLNTELVYQGETVGPFLYKGDYKNISENSKISWIPATNAGILWVLIAFGLPMLGIKQLERITTSKGSTVFYVLALVGAVIIASHLGHSYLWQEEVFYQGEQFLLGNRDIASMENWQPGKDVEGSVFDDHTGLYTKDSETRFGILKWEVKHKDGKAVSGTGEGETVNPLMTLLVAFLLITVGFGVFERKLSIPGTDNKTFKNLLIFLFAATAASTGKSVATLINLTYFVLIFVFHNQLKGSLGKIKTLKFLPVTAAIFFAEVIVSTVSPVDSFFPLFDSIWLSGPFALGAGILFTGAWDILGYAEKGIAKVKVCKECGTIITEMVAGKPFCSVCSTKCYSCGEGEGERKPVTVYECTNDNYGENNDKPCPQKRLNQTFYGKKCPECKRDGERVRDDTEIRCNNCNAKIENKIQVDEIYGFEALTAPKGLALSRKINAKIEKKAKEKEDKEKRERARNQANTTQPDTTSEAEEGGATPEPTTA